MRDVPDALDQGASVPFRQRPSGDCAPPFPPDVEVPDREAALVGPPGVPVAGVVNCQVDDQVFERRPKLSVRRRVVLLREVLERCLVVAERLGVSPGRQLILKCCHFLVQRRLAGVERQDRHLVAEVVEVEVVRHLVDELVAIAAESFGEVVDQVPQAAGKVEFQESLGEIEERLVSLGIVFLDGPVAGIVQSSPQDFLPVVVLVDAPGPEVRLHEEIEDVGMAEHLADLDHAGERSGAERLHDVHHPVRNAARHSVFRGTVGLCDGQPNSSTPCWDLGCGRSSASWPSGCSMGATVEDRARLSSPPAWGCSGPGACHRSRERALRRSPGACPNPLPNASSARVDDRV
ncbi:hypothetical protein SHJG_p1011 (plasmid) [Streptomyces hygroscopicus subsp. jinggangensis 5008]|nr:hypothetical protein SHJG_p1011 [Streptomyces hygroscopicus subsp. jinggangensis 5008]AGF68296.1 hypothetical protein SHJGH_p1011 [Streptomyces hygroscopicus subsp. jinggangensis TL01]